MPAKVYFENNKRYYEVWKKFVDEDILSQGILKEYIESSWMRSRSYGIKPDKCEVRMVLSSDELGKRRLKYLNLINIARPFMEAIYNSISEIDMIVRLTDPEGYVIEVFGNDSVFLKYSELNLKKGSNVSERAIGTNAIGLVLQKNRPYQVMGYEHYRSCLHEWTTAAAPIKDQDGNLLGVISMSGSFDLFHPHTFGLIISSSLAIEHEMSLDRINNELKRTNEHYYAIMESITEGILCIDSKGNIIDINMFARKFLKYDDGDLKNITLRDILANQSLRKILNGLKNHQKFEEEELYLLDKNGRRRSCIMNLTPVENSNGDLKEYVFTFRGSKKIHSLVNKIVGAKAIYTFDDILGQSKKINDVIKVSKLVSDTDATILLNGESGTGKELFAQSIHNASKRKGNSFVFLNCGAIPRELVASELFGYVEGAFTGARKGGTPGKFELADGGTIFLDEIGDMPLDAQANLLRVLETKEVMRVGGHDLIPIDVRVIAATHKNLNEEVKRGNFRQDLFFRLNVMPITTPSLRERKEDIPVLIDNFYDYFTKKEKKSLVGISKEVYRLLTKYDWPGNVRELQNVMQLMVNMAQDDEEIVVKHLPKYLMETKVQGDYKFDDKLMSLDDIERSAIIRTIKHCQGNLVKTAKVLGIGRTTLYRKLQKYNIE
ncbi:MAG: sigma 54-interacting transcriptional regulator [Firmicutes bacterium]|jgi:PAS domain S-box-containing protein|nr:sigma 54-interacting transcriptional regulator [Bacillota bacterium]